MQIPDSPLIQLVKEHPQFAVAYQDFNEIEEIGENSNCKVFLAQYQITGKTVALKRMNIEGETLSDSEEAAYAREIEMLIKINSPILLKLVGFTVSPPFCIVTEFISNGSLFNALHNMENSPKLDGTQLSIIACLCAIGFKNLHDNFVIHGNIKSSNVLLDNDCFPHIVDFTCSKLVAQHPDFIVKKHVFVNDKMGSINWQAPEVVNDLTKLNAYSDIYSFGMLLYEMLTGKIPFEGLDEPEIRENIKNGVLPEIPEGTNAHLASTIKKCWSSNPKERPTIEHIIQSFKKHKIFFPGCDFKIFDQHIRERGGTVQFSLQSINPNASSSNLSSESNDNLSDADPASLPNMPSMEAVPKLSNMRRTSFIEICPIINERNRRRTSSIIDPNEFLPFYANYKEHMSDNHEFQITPEMNNPTNPNYAKIIISALSRVTIAKFYDLFVLVANNFSKVETRTLKKILISLEKTLSMNEKLAELFMERKLYKELPLLNENVPRQTDAIFVLYFKMYQEKITLDFINTILALLEQKVHANMITELNKATHESTKSSDPKFQNMANFEAITNHFIENYQTLIKTYEQIAFISLIFVIYINSFKASNIVHMKPILALEYSFITNSNDPIVVYFGYKAMLDFNNITKGNNTNRHAIIDSATLEKHLHNEVKSNIATLYSNSYASDISLTPTHLQTLLFHLQMNYQKRPSSPTQEQLVLKQNQDIENALITIINKRNDALPLFLQINQIWLNDNETLSDTTVLAILQRYLADEETKTIVGNLPNLATFFNHLISTGIPQLISFIYPLLARFHLGPLFLNSLNENHFLLYYLNYAVDSEDVHTMIDCISCAELVSRKAYIQDFIEIIHQVAEIMTSHPGEANLIRACVSFLYYCSHYQTCKETLKNAFIINILQNITIEDKLLPYTKAINDNLQ